MKKVGITGGIGSGKTLVSGLFERLGIPVYHADERARELMETSGTIRERLTALLGQAVYQGRRLNRQLLAEALFSDEALRQKVNSIVHPVVFEDFEAWASSFSGRPYVMQEAAIIFESGGDRYLDSVINVYAPRRVRIERVMKRDGVSREAVLARIRSQMSERQRQRRAGHTIVNDGRRMVVPQVVKVDGEMRS
jgi:dephospho-CoA kinase